MMMGSDMERLRGIFNRRLADAGTNTVYGKVLSVDERLRVCTLEIDGIPYEGVFLYAIEKPQVKGYCVIPKVDSIVLASYIGFKDRVFVSMFSEIEKVVWEIDDTRLVISAQGVVFNGGTNEGMVMIKELKDNIESLKQYVEAIHSALPDAFTAIGAGATASGPTASKAYSGAMTGKSIEIKEMENKLIKH